MTEELDTNEAKSPFLPSSPSLTPYLTNLYNSLDSFNKGVFIQVFRFIWSYLFGCNTLMRRSGVLYNFWLVDSIRLRFSLTTSELSALSFLYKVSNKGVNLVRSELFYNGPVLPDFLVVSKINLLHDLKRAGYITRHTKDPGQPYSQHAQHNKQPVFICLTSSGVRVIESIEKDLYKILLNTSLDDLTGLNKKT